MTDNQLHFDDGNLRWMHRNTKNGETQHTWKYEFNEKNDGQENSHEKQVRAVQMHKYKIKKKAEKKLSQPVNLKEKDFSKFFSLPKSPWDSSHVADITAQNWTDVTDTISTACSNLLQEKKLALSSHLL